MTKGKAKRIPKVEGSITGGNLKMTITSGDELKEPLERCNACHYWISKGSLSLPILNTCNIPSLQYLFTVDI